MIEGAGVHEEATRIRIGYGAEVIVVDDMVLWAHMAGPMIEDQAD